MLNNTISHYYDSGTQCHSLGLVMCYIDNSGSKSLMQLSNLNSHLYTEFCIQVGQRLVHKKYLWITYNCSPHSNTLPLTTGQSLGLTIKKRGKIKHLGCFFYHFINLVFRNLSQLQTKCHIIIDSHMRI